MSLDLERCPSIDNCHASPKACQVSPKNFTQDIIIEDILNESKYTICLAQSASTGRNYAVKLFPYVNDNIDEGYYNEIKAAHLCH
mmetsp:Transcript_11359/g.9773  ORF Transcript_11359/g.9773 Transcript_11359/m.9773 type:complete len:85 (-) Transcript_11359:933-1187(-)